MSRRGLIAIVAAPVAIVVAAAAATLIRSIVLYLRHLPPAGSLGEPEMYGH